MMAAAATAIAESMVVHIGFVGGPIGMPELEVWVVAMLVTDMLVAVS